MWEKKITDEGWIKIRFNTLIGVYENKFGMRRLD